MAQSPDYLNQPIQQQDPLAVKMPYLDFQNLRREGLEHLGELSGKIWTDHNAHDPGITILEVLCYALLDLGHRTTLPIEDLLATEQDMPDFSEDDNFFTPLEILSCNPTTILDFRKLLLEIKGVRNAWLIPAEEQEVPLYVDLYREGTTLTCSKPEDFTCNTGREAQKNCPAYAVRLNGLFNVFLDLKPWAGAPGSNQEKAYICDTLDQVRSLLSKHRNLCEDFKDITILAPCKIGICANIQLESDAFAAKIYAEVLQVVQDYISPEVTYYTLQQLLDKGRTLEEIFAGRPYNTESFGFVDTEELLQMPLRKALYLSDLYQLILGIKGVIAVQSLTFKSEGGTSQTTLGPFKIPEGYVPHFDLSVSCIGMNNGLLDIDFDKKTVEKRVLNSVKAKLGRNKLDFPIPKGVHYADLKVYRSIQNDFPNVYGIGPGGLAADEPLLRKVQAQQLKGYLLFFDQLLINYLNQLTHLRQLFSIRQESKRPLIDRHSYFTQELNQVPDIEQLLLHRAKGNLRQGSTIAVSVVNDVSLMNQLVALDNQPNAPLLLQSHCELINNSARRLAESSSARLDARIQQAIRDFVQGDYVMQTHEDLNGHFFVICFTQYPEWVLVGYQRYLTAQEAHEAANFAAFLAIQPNNYQKSIQQNNQNTLDFGFDLKYHPLDYQDYLQYLLEDESRYCARRNAFLDHLLARFSAQFTDYSLLRFGTAELKKNDQQQEIEEKSRRLDHIDQISRDRGRAFDYRTPSWGTENVSGFEKRIAMLAGMKDWKRRKLCKFEVVPSMQYPLNDIVGPALCKEISGYPDAPSLTATVKTLMLQLRDPSQYSKLTLRYPALNKVEIKKRFSTVPGPENTVPSSFYYRLQLVGATAPENVLQISEKQDFANEKQALAYRKTFLSEIKSGPYRKLKLNSAGKSATLFIDESVARMTLLPYRTYKWRANLNGSTFSGQVFSSPEAAWDDLVRVYQHAAFLTRHTEVFEWEAFPAGDLRLFSTLAFRTQTAAERAWLRCKPYGVNPANYQAHQDSKGGSWLQLKTEQGTVLAHAQVAAGVKIQPLIKACCAIFAAKKDKLTYHLSESSHFGFLLLDADGNAMMESMALYQYAEDALKALNEAHIAASDDKHYFDTGSEEHPEYRKLLRSKDDQFIASTLPPYESAPKPRDAAFKNMKKALKALKPLFHIEEQNLRFKWRLLLVENQSIVLESAQSFELQEGALSDFESAMEQVWQSGESPVAEYLYGVDVAKVVAKYRYRYELDVPGTYLQSEKEYEEISDAQLDYANFILALPALSSQDGRFVAKIDENEIVVIPSNKDAAAAAQMRVKEMRGYYIDAEIEDKIVQKWVYRMVDIDHPQAVSADLFDDCDAAQAAKQTFCSFQPFPYDPKKLWLQVICPPQNPGKFHAAVCLQDEQGKSHIILHSYQGYDTWDAAMEAGKSQGLQWIALATQATNFGPTKPIGLEEVYASAPDPCLTKSSFVAVIPQQFVKESGSVAAAVASVINLSKRFPFRVVITTDANGREKSRKYIFQGYDLLQDKVMWQSPVEYPDFETCSEAYLLFTVLLCNPNSCRVHCEYLEDCDHQDQPVPVQELNDCDCAAYDQKCIVKLRYRIHLVEIMVQSDPFEHKKDAWGELPPEPSEAACDKITGVRKFTQAANADLGFVQTSTEGCYHFKVVSNKYLVANHTCSYYNANALDAAIQIVKVWATTTPATPDFEVKSIQTGDKWRFLLVNQANEQALQKQKTVCGCEEKSQPPAAVSDHCLKQFYLESALVFDSKTLADAYLPGFLELLKDPANYQVTQESGIGPFSFTIVDQKEVLARHPYLYHDKEFSMQAEERAKAQIEDDGMHLLEHILLRPLKKGNCDCLLPICPEKECAIDWEEESEETDPCASSERNDFRYVPGTDPYSFWATVVLPGWHQRFSTQASRDAFMHLLHTEAPALVALNIVWLSPQQMCKFETAFQNWLNDRLYPGLRCDCHKSEKDPYCVLVDGLQKMYNDPICSGNQSASLKPCNCVEAPVRGSDCLVEPDSLFWWKKPENTQEEEHRDHNEHEMASIS